MNRRHVVQLIASSGGLLGAACGIGGGPAGGATTQSACTSEVDFVSPFNVGTVNGDGLLKVADDYTAANQGCKATMLFLSDNNTQIQEKLVASVIAGTPPAVAMVPAQQTPFWVSKGVIQPLTKFAQRDKVSKEQFFEGYWPQMELQGQLWRLPMQIDVNFPLYWNKSMLRAGGFPTDKAPATIDELDRMAIALTRSPTETNGQMGIVPWREYNETNSLQTWAFAFGGKFHDASGTKVTANDPKIVQALEWMVGWARRLGGHQPIQQVFAADPRGHEGLLASGKLAFSALTSGGMTLALQANPQAELGGGPWPGATGVKPGEATWLSGRGIGVVQGAKDPEAAWRFVRWTGGTNEGTESCVKRFNAVPGLKTSPGLKLLEQSPVMAPHVVALRAAKHTPPGGVLPVEMWGSGRGALIAEVLQQKRAAREVMDEITRAAQVELDAELARSKK